MTTKETSLSNKAENLSTGHLLSLGNSEALMIEECDDGSGLLSDVHKIELLSEEVQEILGQTPRWMVRWGMTVIFFVLLLVFSGSFIFKYPDVISGSVVIVSENPPAPIMAQATGKIEFIFVKNQEMVKPGSYLAILENTANYKHILELKEKLKFTREKFILNDFSDLTGLPDNFSLGSVQGPFSNFQRQYNEYRNYLAINIIGQKTVALNKQISDYKKYSERLNIQAGNLLETLKLQYNQYKRDSLLFSTEVIAPADFEKSAQTYLQAKSIYHGLLASVANTEMQINQLQYQLVDLQSQLLDQTGSRINSLKEALDNLLSSITAWEKSFVLISPIEGKVTFVNFWSPNQYAITGNQVFTIVPSRPQSILGKLKFPVAGSGKVEKGQKVLIRLENFPYTEFGMLEGKVAALSLIPEITQQGSFYTAEIIFEKGLITNYGKTLPLNQEMPGSAEIITKNLSTFERLVSPLKAALKKSI
jgi:HlyD family secretion protein